MSDLDKLVIDKKWLNSLSKYLDPYSILSSVEKVEALRRNGKNIFPPNHLLFNAYNKCSLSNIKIVIFGQDPYPNKGQANGLSFSSNKDHKIPKSLRNIFNEISSDIGIENHNPDLTSWANQGVLLLNTCLSVEEGIPLSHTSIGWSLIIDGTLKLLAAEKKNIVFILWGKNSQKLQTKINDKENLILKSSHPSPLSFYRGFDGCKHFSKANSYLKKNNLTEIDWAT